MQPREVAMNDEIIVLADREGVLRFWSLGAERAFGYSASEAVGQSLDLIVPPEYRDAHWIGFRRAFATGAASVEGQSAPFPVRSANGDTSVWTGRLTLIRGPRGGVVGAAVVFEPVAADHMSEGHA